MFTLARLIPALALGSILAASAAGQTPLSPNPVIPDAFGVNTHFMRPRPGEVEMLAAGGFRWIRTDLTWAITEKKPGVYDFSTYDSQLAALKAQGIHALFVFDYGNPLYDHGDAPHSDAGRKAFTAWAVAAAKHFAGNDILWEMWNEPNGLHSWKPQRNVDQYIALAQMVGKALKEAAPNEAYVGPALSTMDLPFVEKCFQAGLLDYWSAVTVHPYRQGPPETVANDYRKLRLLIARYAPAGKTVPIISGEWGYSSVWPHYDDQRQGKMLARQWLLNLSQQIPLSIWYDWHDDGQKPQDEQHHFGTVAFDYDKTRQPLYQPKPAYEAAQTLTTILNGYRFNKRLVVGSADDYVMLLEKDGNVKLAAWTTGADHDVTIPASAGRFTATTFNDAALPPIIADARGLVVHLTDAPLYLAPKVPNDLLRIAAAWERLPLEVTAKGPADVMVKTRLKNPTTQAIAVKPSTGAAVELAAGQTATFAVPVTVPRSDSCPPVRLELQINGQARFAQQAAVAASNPLNVTATPAGEKAFSLRVLNPSGEPFTGTVSLAGDGTSLSAAGPLELTSGEKEKFLRLDTAAPVPNSATMHIKIIAKDGRVASESVQSYSGDIADQLAGGDWSIQATGKGKSAAEATVTPSDAPTSPVAGPVFKIDYRFPAGPNYLSLTTKTTQAKTIAGEPASLGLWIYGDENGGRLSLRFRDSTGQVFQPSSDAADWKGWRFVSFPMNDAGVFHYQGADDGVIHYPVQWMALLMMDTNARHKPNQGAIYLSSPVLIWDSPVSEQ